MEQFLREKLEFDDVFDRLKQMQSYLEDTKKLELFNLPKPVCLQNAYMMNMFYINNKWSDIFPSLQTIEKYIKEDQKLFYLPDDSYYFFLYYHLLVACKKFHEADNNKKIYDSETALDYEVVNNYLVRKNLDATKFFEIYLEKGLVLDDAELSGAILQNSNEELDDVANRLDEVIVHEMSSEPLLASAPDLEVEKIEDVISLKKSNVEDEEEGEGKVRLKENKIY